MMFKIPERTTHDPKMLEYIAMMVKECLTLQWFNIKQKVCYLMCGSCITY